MRYFMELSYNGTRFHGWQRQPNASSIQQTLEEAMGMLMSIPIAVVGCGRTDTGVHAKQYFLHFEFSKALPENFIFRLNRILSKDIAIHQIFEVEETVHARFDATHRAYEYHILFEKSPFQQETAWVYPLAKRIDILELQKAVKLLLKYEDFYPFCKSNTDVKTMRCAIYKANWEKTNNGLVFHIAADRFLRGMVRLIVGMCINVGLGKLTLNDVQTALDTQSRLDKSYSVPPQGLFLTDIRYANKHF